MFSLNKPLVAFTVKLDPICPLCGLPLMKDKLHHCGQMDLTDWVNCKGCGTKWNPGMFKTAPETCGFCVIVIAAEKEPAKRTQ